MVLFPSPSVLVTSRRSTFWTVHAVVRPRSCRAWSDTAPATMDAPMVSRKKAPKKTRTFS
ncbi:MAG: hypothetical protein HOV83_41205, partial [Catenulispora sp.]|nr:hypothetical protein [Catenulispora sp.]